MPVCGGTGLEYEKFNLAKLRMVSYNDKIVRQRNSSIEIMRLLSMILIVVHHIVGQGLGFQFYCLGGSYAQITNWFPIICIESFCIVGVNLFILISGFYGIRLKSKSVIKFLTVVLGFVVLHTTAEYLYNPEFSIKAALRKVVFFYSENTAWFVKSYFLLMLSSFIINPALKQLSKAQLMTVLAILVYINVYLGFVKHWDINENGYTLSHMVMIYVIGHALNTFDIAERIKKRTCIFGYILLSLFLALTIAFFLDKTTGDMTFRLLGYNNPIIMLSSICLFCFFVKNEFVDMRINFFASGIFGIYLLHQYHPLWTKVMIPNIRLHYEMLSISTFLLYSFLLVFLIITIGIAVNLMINKLIDSILNMQRIKEICMWWDNKLGL